MLQQHQTAPANNHPVLSCASCQPLTSVASSAEVLCETAEHGRVGHDPGTAPPRSDPATVHLLRCVSADIRNHDSQLHMLDEWACPAMNNTAVSPHGYASTTAPSPH